MVSVPPSLCVSLLLSSSPAPLWRRRDVSYAGDLSTFRLMLHAQSITFNPHAGGAELLGRREPVGPGAAESTEARALSSTGRRAKARAKREREAPETSKCAWPEAQPLPLGGLRFASKADPFEGVFEEDLP
jgi:hypothetical protein